MNKYGNDSTIHRYERELSTTPERLEIDGSVGKGVREATCVAIRFCAGPK